MSGPVEWLTAKLDWVETTAATPIFHRPDLLRRAAVDQQILAEHAPGQVDDEANETECRTCTAVSPGMSGMWPVEYPCRTVRLLAEAWGWETP